MNLQNRYRWEATLEDGTVIHAGEDLTGARLVSLIPDTPLFPRHDFSGLRFIRRFGRGFLHGLGGGMKEYAHCIVCRQCRLYVRSSTGSVLITPPDYEFYV
jgi:hypothetical protein